MQHHAQDFTESEYRGLLRIARETWEFAPYTRYREAGRLCLWRHDLDFSIHRAYRLAQIEAEEGVTATHFIHLHSNFYNALEPEIATLLLRIRDLGHDLALHFDPGFYARMPGFSGDVFDFLEVERDVVERTFGVKVHAFSMHNPDTGPWLETRDDEVRGLINTYGSHLRTNYRYISDSNGYWRFDRLHDVLASGADHSIQVLTHPEWWTPEAMQPRDRVSRCIEGRAARQHREYDELLERMGRVNVR